jgi:hypothetical protein
MIATVVIPVSPHHGETGVYEEAVTSVHAQTVPTAVEVVHDTDGNGAAWARNAGTRRVETPFVIYLDADDLLEPAFVEQAVQHYQRGHYVYTDWMLDGERKTMPGCLNSRKNGLEHIVTTLLPVAAWRAAGGFDEDLDTLEDEDFYRRLHSYGWCGARCPESLVTYRREKGRSLTNRTQVDNETFRERVDQHARLFDERYRRFGGMGCGCNDETVKPPEAGEDDVLVETLYSPMTQVGAVTKRKYPRRGMGYPMWVDRRDAEARPDLFRILASNPDSVSPDPARVIELAQRTMADEGKQADAPPAPAPKPPTRPPLQPSPDDPPPTKPKPPTRPPATQEADHQTGVDAMGREDVKAALDDLDVEYSKYAHTSTLKDLLREHYAPAD